MSLYDDASLIMYPSGYKEDKIYSLKPTDGSGDLTFTRASTATRVNAEGLIETSPVNLLTYSNDFSNAAWLKDRCTLTYGQSGYDGTSNAWLMQSTATALSSRCYQVFSGSNNFNRSVYAKKGTSDYVAIYTTSSGYAYFNLSNGTIGTQSNNINASILSVGDGWYRCSVTMSSIYDNHYIFVANSDNITTTNSGDNIYIQDAQLNIGTTAKPYFPTTDRLNVPRIDYTGGGCGSLLLEPQRTNLITYSSEFDNAAWTKSNSTITANNTTSPDGTQNADKLTATSTSCEISIAGSSVDGYSTIFAKAGNISKISLYRGNVSFGTNFDLSNGTITSGQGTIQDYGDGWYRVGVKLDANRGINPYITNITNGDYIYIYGAQLEASSYPTSYIPTTSTAVTRLADSASKTGISSLINSEEGVLYAEIAAFNDQTLNNWISISEDANINANQFNLRYVASSNLIQAVSRAAGLGQDVVLNYTLTDKTALNKIAIKYKVNDWALWVNGVEVDTETSSTAFTANSLDVLDFNRGNDSNFFYGKVQNLMVFPSALSDNQLADLTGGNKTTFNALATTLGYTIL